MRKDLNVGYYIGLDAEKSKLKNVGDMFYAEDTDRMYRINSSGNPILINSPGGAQNLDETLANGNVTDKDIVMQKADEQAIIMKRLGTVGITTNPQFSFGRIVNGGINEPKLRVGFIDDEAYTSEVFPFEVEPSGTAASIRQVIGSHYEAFVGLEEQPMFRLSSIDIGGGNKSSRIELGSGGTNGTDTMLERLGTNQLAVVLGGSAKVIFYADSMLRQPGVSDAFQQDSNPVATPNSDVKKIFYRTGVGMVELGGDGVEKPMASDLYNTEAELPDPTTLKVGKMAVVVNDPTPGQNGSYVVVGANIGSNGTSWIKA